jgi:hypothetical protein
LAGDVVQWHSVCLACVKSCVQSPAPKTIFFFCSQIVVLENVLRRSTGASLPQLKYFFFPSLYQSTGTYLWEMSKLWPFSVRHENLNLSFFEGHYLPPWDPLGSRCSGPMGDIKSRNNLKPLFFLYSTRRMPPRFHVKVFRHFSFKHIWKALCKKAGDNIC